LRVVDGLGKPLALQASVGLDIQPESSQKPVERTLVLAAPIPDHNADAVSLPSAQARIEQPARIQANGFITGVVMPTHLSVNVKVYNITGTVETSKYADYLTGAYSVTVQPGTYKVKFEPIFSDYAPEWYNNQPDMNNATPVVVSDGAVRPNINAALDIGGKIAGRVTAAGSSTPLASVYVYAYTSTTGTSYVAYDYTDASGVYTITGLLTGSYYLKFDPPYGSDYLVEYYNDKGSLATADPIPVTLGGVVSGKDAALETGGKIAGRVTAAGSSTPLQDVYVYAYTSTTSTSSVAYEYTDASGIYTITGLLTGTYYLKFAPPYGTGYLTEYYNNKFTLAEANGVSVALGGVVIGVDAALDIGGKITGQVTAAVGATPVDNVYIWAYTSTTSTSWEEYANTDASGVYTITDLLSGTYYLKFDPPYGTGYLTEYYNDKRSLATADAIPVAFNLVVSNTNAALDTGGIITGHVTAAAGGTPIQNVSVYVYTSTTSTSAMAYGDTDATGAYTITGLATGYYYLQFNPPSSDYYEQYYDNKSTLASADAISVTLNSVIANRNAVLKSASKITGRVTAAGSGTPLKDVDVTVYSYRCACNCSYTWMGSATTNDSGFYTVTGLLAGSYRVEFDPIRPGVSAVYLGEYYNDKASLSTADPVAVADSSTTSGIDAALALGGQITGRVTATDGGSPLKDVWVDAYDSSGHYVNDSRTDATGVYTITDLAAGSYRVEFDPSGASAAYLSEYYNNRSTWGTADAINVTSGGVTGNINAVLDRGGQIRGQVTAADGGALLEDVEVNVYDSNGNWEASVTTNASGVYTTTGLTTGCYRLLFSTQDAFGAARDYIDEYYNDKSSLAAANAIPVAAPNVVSGINAVLARGGKISGRVTAADTGGPLSGIKASAYDSTGTEVRYDYTDSSGDYVITGLPSGNYRVRFYPICIFYSDSGTIKRYAGEYYNDKTDLATANVVVVTAPSTTSSIDAVLGGGVAKFVYLPVVLR
jgi:5-hydroxyisourate hydrolase-like protein (transthyretin family)